MNSKFTWILCLLIIALNSCTTSEDNLFGTLSGIITDAETKEPLKGVTVSIVPVGDTKVTGSDGAYTFLNLDPTEYTITFKKDGYETDTKRVSVLAGGNSKADMALVPLRPKLSVSLKTLEFGTENTTLTLDISNTGYGVLQWKITDDIEWLDCKPTSGNTEKEATSVIVTVSREGWAKGEYSRTFAISSNGGSEVITANMSVDGCNLSVEPKEIDFGSTESTAQLTLTNKGKGTVSYQATSSNEWLNLSKTSGKVTEKDYITVSVNRGVLAAGEYSGIITFTIDKDVINVPIKLSISAKAKPVISLDAIKNIAYNGATLAGTVVNVGNSKITRYGFCWSQKTEPTLEDDFTNMGDCSVPLSFEGIITDLAANTKYYVRAYAENNEGITFSNEESFTTAGVPIIPTVQTQQATDISSSMATAHGQITSLGNVTIVTQHGHVWGTSEQLDINLSTKTALGKTEKPLAFASEMKGLKPNQKYYVRAYATNEKGTAYGDVLEFTTAKADMQLSTSEVTSIIHDAATCGGLISDYGGHAVKECGVCWSLKEDAVSIADRKVTGTVKDNAWSCRIEGLTKETTYFVRSYVESIGGTVFYGEVRSFTTTQEVKLPTLGKVSVTGVDIQGATLQSSVTDSGNSNVTVCGFCWSTKTNPTTDDESVACELQNGAFGQKISGLKDGTKYYVRAYATNAMGTAYSENAELTTTSVTVPEWANTSVSNIGRTKVTVKASLVSNGNSDITEMGICWSTHPQTTIYDNKQVCKTDAAVSTQLTGLLGTTTYYLRAYAQNSKGIGYSNEVVFTTADSEVDVWDGVSVATSFAGGLGTEADPIRIETAAQLKLLADKVNAGTKYDGIYFKLVANIDLANKEWTPIGGNDNKYLSFAGGFDGGNNCISELKINTTKSYVGLFGCMSGGNVSNLKVIGKIKTSNNDAGMICGNATEDVFFNNIEISGSVEGHYRVGGLIGHNERYRSAIITNSVNKCNIVGEKCVGGFVGGGYANYVGDFKIINSINYGEIVGKENVGGLIGGEYPGVEILNCCNYSNVNSGYGIVESTSTGYGSYKCSVTNCFWLNDIFRNKGTEAGFGIPTNKLNHFENSGYFTCTSMTCILIQLDNKDLISELNKWVDENGSSTYHKWEYKTMDGYACPALK